MQGLGIKIGNKWLRLRPGTTLEMERNNPHLQFGDEIVGDYSLPTEIDNDPYNEDLIDYSGYIQKRQDGAGKDCGIYSNGFQYGIAKLKIEKPIHNINRASDGTTNIYFLGGAANFYQDIKNLRLQDINVGGARTFANDNFNVNGTGFWGHIHKVINGSAGYGTSAFDYAFFPVWNEDFDGREVLNLCDYTGGMVQFAAGNAQFTWVNRISPFPYLKYILLKAVEYAGWKIVGTPLDDPQFCKITMINSLCIQWGYKQALSYHMNASISFDLANHLPDISITEFLIWTKNRLGWRYDFDRVAKTIRVSKVETALHNVIKPLTKYSSPVVTKAVSQEKKIYAIKVNGDDKDIDLSTVDYKGLLNNKASLPAAAAALNNQVYLIVDENNYYICQADTNNTFIWDLLTPNNRSVVPAGATEDIITNAQIPMMRTNPGAGLLVQWDESGFLSGRNSQLDYSASFVIAFYYGLHNSPGGHPLPLASTSVYDSLGNLVGTWSLSLRAKKFDGSEIGLYDLNWKKFLERISSNEVFTATLNLPWVEYLKLEFGDIINIANVNMYVTKIREVIPYSGSVEIEAVRS